MAKSPGQFDGKAIGAAMHVPNDPKRAGVTMGKDQVERDAERRSFMRSLQRKLIKARKRHTYDPILARAAKDRKKAAQVMKRQFNKGRTIEWIAAYHGVTTDEAMKTIQWVKAKNEQLKRGKHNKRRNRANRVAIGLPEKVTERSVAFCDKVLGID